MNHDKKRNLSAGPIAKFLVMIGLAVFFQVASAGTNLTSPATDGATFINGTSFAATVTPDVASIEMYAGVYRLGVLNAANNWKLPYIFNTRGFRQISAKSYDSAGNLLSTIDIGINVVDVLMLAPKANSTFLNGTAVTIDASTSTARVVLKADTYEIARSSSRNANNQFVITPPLLNTIGKRNLIVEAYTSAGNLLDTQTTSVTVANLVLNSSDLGTTYLPGAPISLTVNTAPGTTEVVYYADTYLLGSVRDSSTHFKFDFSLQNTGKRLIRAISYNAGGTKLQEASQAIYIVNSAFTNNLQAALTSAWKKSGLPGVSVSVLTPDQGMVYAKAGIASVNTNDVIIPNQTRYRIASVTKNFAATLILRMQEAGLLNIDDKLSTHLSIPGLANGNIITIRQLLNHSSGVADYLDDSQAFLNAAVPGKIFSDTEIIGYINALGSSFTPGSQYGYSNGNFYVLGMLIAKKLNTSIDVAMNTWVINPLGLTSTYLDLTSSASNPITDLAASSRPYAYSTTSVKAAGAIVSTSADLAKYSKAIYGGTFLSKASIAAMETGSSNNNGYGLGTRITTVNGVLNYGHTGTLLNYNSVTYYIPSMNVSVGINTNDYAGTKWGDVKTAVYNAVAAEYTGYCATRTCP